RVGISGGAPLAREVIEFFHALDVLILEAYGLTECTTGCAGNRPTAFRFGTVGQALHGAELRIADDGEVLIRSETVFAGYYKDEAATREVLGNDGWLASGDIGSIDGGGVRTVTGRQEDILGPAGGKNVAPQNLENALKTSPLISQALVVGDRRPYVAALVTLEEGVSRDGIDEKIQAVVDDVNRDLSRFEQIKRFTVLPRDFSADEGEVTPTLKLKRRICQEHFAGEIEALYACPATSFSFSRRSSQARSRWWRRSRSCSRSASRATGARRSPASASLSSRSERSSPSSGRR